MNKVEIFELKNGYKKDGPQKECQQTNKVYIGSASRDFRGEMA